FLRESTDRCHLCSRPFRKKKLHPPAKYPNFSRKTKTKDGIMTMPSSKLRRNLVCLLATLAFLLPALLSAAEMTAFEVMKEANRYVGEQARDRLLRVWSE